MTRPQRQAVARYRRRRSRAALRTLAVELQGAEHSQVYWRTVGGVAINPDGSYRQVQMPVLVDGVYGSGWVRPGVAP